MSSWKDANQIRSLSRQTATFLKLLCHPKSETSNVGSPLISLSGPETARTLSQNLSRASEHNASSIMRASSTGFSFYWGGPLQRPAPLSFHIRVPTPVIWLASTETLFHSRCLSLTIPQVSFILISHPQPPAPPPPTRCSITILTSNEERTRLENYDVIPRSGLQMEHTFLSWCNTKQEEDLRGSRNKDAFVFFFHGATVTSHKFPHTNRTSHQNCHMLVEDTSENRQTALPQAENVWICYKNDLTV